MYKRLLFLLLLLCWLPDFHCEVARERLQIIALPTLTIIRDNGRLLASLVYLPHPHPKSRQMVWTPEATTLKFFLVVPKEMALPWLWEFGSFQGLWFGQVCFGMSLFTAMVQKDLAHSVGATARRWHRRSPEDWGPCPLLAFGQFTPGIFLPERRQDALTKESALTEGRRPSSWTVIGVPACTAPKIWLKMSFFLVKISRGRAAKPTGGSAPDCTPGGQRLHRL